MATFTKHQEVEICPAKSDHAIGQWAEFDGAVAEVLSLRGSGPNLQVQVRLTKGTRSGEETFPAAILKPTTD